MSSEQQSAARVPRIAIVGAGPGGLCMAAKLREAGFDDIAIFEKADALGGTWHHNRYPGCACDIPSYLYSFSFEPSYDWSRPYAPQPEILAYMQRFAEKYDLLRHCRLGCGVQSLGWDPDGAFWTLRLESSERVEADVVVSAIGMFNDLAWPDIPGLDRFRGTSFHSARWDWDHDLAGERVGVIGSAASAVQFVPEIVKEAAQVHLFQRTANWVLPKLDDPFTEEQLAAFRGDPSIAVEVRRQIFEGVDAGITFSDPKALEQFEAAGLAAIEEVEDEDVRRKLRPDHPFGCKRPLMSNHYYAAFNRPNLELVTDPIERIEETAVVTADGRSRTVDTLILASGFSATKYLSALEVTGRDGRTIQEAWDDGAQAYLGITTAGFPNLFVLYGPNTNNGSILTMIEAQVGYVVDKVEWMAREGLRWIDVRPEPMARYNEEIQAGIAGVKVWNAGCNGYYRTPSGRVVTQWPFSMTEYEKRTARPDAEAFEVGAA